jgi:hypothetical protein
MPGACAPGDDHDEEDRTLDSDRFDGLVRSFGRTASRRQTLRGLAGVAAAGALGGREATAATKPADAKCSSGSQCASGTCIMYGKCKKKGKLSGKCRCSCSETALCPTGKSCRNGACFADCPTPSVCPEGDPQICDPKKGCMCWETDLGPSCTSADDSNCSIECTTSADCATGQVCQDIGPTCFANCARKFCINPCGLGGDDPTTSPVITSVASSAEHATKRQGNRFRADVTEFGR